MADTAVKIPFAEAAAPSTPAANKVVIYAKSDGLMYSKDDAGTETLMSGGAGGGGVATDPIWDAAGDLAVGTGANTAARLAIGNAGGVVARINGAVAWNAGTAFPTAATGDRYFRTDRGLEYYYDGTRWVTVQLYAQDLGSWANVAAGSASHGPVWAADYDQWLVDFRAVMLTASASSGSAYWRLDLYTPDGTTLGSAVATVNNASATNNSYDRKTANIGALLGTGKDGFVADLVKVTTPGNFYGAAMVTYRLVG